MKINVLYTVDVVLRTAFYSYSTMLYSTYKHHTYITRDVDLNYYFSRLPLKFWTFQSVN